MIRMRLKMDYYVMDFEVHDRTHNAAKDYGS